MFIRVPNTICVEIRQLMDNQEIECTLNFQGDAMPSDEDVKEITIFMGAWWVASVVPLLAPQNIYMETYGWSRDTLLGPQWTATPANPVPGGNGNPSMPNENALFVSFKLPSRGIKGRYGNFISGVPKIEVDGNYVDATWAGDIVAAYNEMKADVLTNYGFVWVGVSLRENNEWRPLGVTYPFTGAGLSDLVIDSQRRRKPGNGS